MEMPAVPGASAVAAAGVVASGVVPVGAARASFSGLAVNAHGRPPMFLQPLAIGPTHAVR
jgi:hypothetical protein